MKVSRATDLLLHVVLPLSVGTCCYLLHASPFLKFHLADGLWAYAFLSTLLIIWDSQIPGTWIFIAILVAISWEFFQFTGLLPGTGDLLDVVFYLAFYGLALTVNRYLNIYSRKKYEI